MNTYEVYYRENIYPLQDGVMHIIQELNTPFFLTGGTALSRHYFNHRFSDDLALFVNDFNKFHALLDEILISFSSDKYEKTFLLDKASIKRYESFSQLFVSKTLEPEIKLKIDFVNDVAPHYGEFEKNDKLGLIDSWRNILSNKLTALFRFEPKDIADIWIIARNKKFSWKSIILEAKTKEAGVEPEVIFNILKSLPLLELSLIKWTIKPDFDKIKNDLNIIANDILFGNENSLAVRGE